MTRIDMHRLQELVRLHRMGTGARKAGKLLKMGPNTARAYRKALAISGLLDGPVDALPELEVLREAVMVQLPPKEKPQHESSITKWADAVTTLLERVLEPFMTPGPGFCLYFPARMQAQPKLQALVDTAKDMRDELADGEPRKRPGSRRASTR